MPAAPADTTTGAAAAEPRRSSAAQPVTAGMPDVIGGNAGRAQEQMGSGIDMVFEDASGRGRPVDDPAAWKICTSRPGPYQQLTDDPVVFGVVGVSESCQDTVPR
ncbi:hypothetical protein GCM10010294_39500 [Streptomyces griseoloalbus]|uniref:hypothetical protein n=1 Tax=Streptomyces griseoloalbus TaxID=67303 RepID=UPI0018765E7E|nr:hypothetical protein GCM10010294_39500 [Streptomyces griseoloalbus]